MKLCEDHVNKFECMIDNIFVILDECVLQQRVDTCTGTKCAPFYTDFFIYLHEVAIRAVTSQVKRKQQVRSFIFCI